MKKSPRSQKRNSSLNESQNDDFLVKVIKNQLYKAVKELRNHGARREAVGGKITSYGFSGIKHPIVNILCV